MRAPLSEYDVPGYDVLLRGFFGAETFPRSGGGFVGAALGGVGGVAGEGDGWEVAVEEGGAGGEEGGGAEVERHGFWCGGAEYD